jgi:RHS repeat-associated protein
MRNIDETGTRLERPDSDTDTGLYYYRARYYDPGVGRFVSEDPLGLNAGINQYAYVHNSPLLRIDPAGTDDYPGIGSAIDAINWARGSYDPVPHIGDPTATALSRTPAAADMMGKYKKANCKDGTYCGDFNFKQYFTTFDLVGQTVGGFCAKIKNIGGGNVLVDGWNDWGLESASRWPQLGSENNRTHPSVQDMLNGAPLQYPKSTFNNRAGGAAATVRTRYVWIGKSPCCSN